MGAVVAGAVLAATGGAYAAVTASSPTITACVRHDGGALYRARTCARRDQRLDLEHDRAAGTKGRLPAPRGHPARPARPACRDLKAIPVRRDRTGSPGQDGAAGPSGVVGATTVLEQVPGPLPLAATFVKQHADTILLMTFAGSGYWSGPPGDTGLAALILDVDDKDVGVSRLYFNNQDEHLAFPDTGGGRQGDWRRHPHDLLAGLWLL